MDNAVFFPFCNLVTQTRPVAIELGSVNLIEHWTLYPIVYNTVSTVAFCHIDKPFAVGAEYGVADVIIRFAFRSVVD